MTSKMIYKTVTIEVENFNVIYIRKIYKKLDYYEGMNMAYGPASSSLSACDTIPELLTVHWNVR